MSGTAFPRVAVAMLRAVLPADWREDIIRDLDEAYVERRAGREGEGRSGTIGRVRDGLWAWGQVGLFALRFLPLRAHELVRAGSLTSLDLRLAVRSAVRHRGLTLVTVVGLALGIGATTTAFGVIVGAFFSALPFPGGDRIHLVEDHNATSGLNLPTRGDEFVRRRDALTSFEYLGAVHSRAVVMNSERRVTARFVTPGVLEMTETAPLMGRLPDAADAVSGAEPVVLLPHDLWMSALGGDSGVVGTRVDIDGVPRTIIGVMPPGFAFPWGDEIWVPLDPVTTREPLRVIGKLRDGVSVEAARAELAVVARRDAREVGPDDVVRHLVTPLHRPVTGNEVVAFLAAPLGALVLVLVVMATNIATVVLARNAARSGELAVRVAIGASRRRVVSGLVLEVGLIVALAAAVGLVLARFALTRFEARVTGLPFWVDFGLDARVVAFTISLAALATVVAGLVPAMRTTAAPLQASLKDSGRGGSAVRFGRTTDLIIVSELGVSVGFLLAAAILGQSLLSFGFARYGLPAEETLVANIYFGRPPALADPDAVLSTQERDSLWSDFEEQATRTRNRILDRALQLPGVRMAAMASRFPGDESEPGRFEVEGGGTGVPRTAELMAVGEGFFELLGVRAVHGRDFTASERAGGIPVALVDEPFVDTQLGGGNPIGRRIRMVAAPGQTVRADAEPGPWFEIVGVVPDLGFSVGDPSRGGTVYWPNLPTNVLWLGIRGEGDPLRWEPGLLEAVREIDPELRVNGADTLERLMMLPILLYRALGFGFLALGGIALLLSAASLHAVTACAVTSRTREIGIRRALGAPSGGLVVMAVRRAFLQLAAGIALGSLLGIGLLRLASLFPWRLGAGNPLLLAAVPAVLGAAVLLALAGPLTRALSIRPADALRSDQVSAVRAGSSKVSRKSASTSRFKAISR